MVHPLASMIVVSCINARIIRPLAIGSMIPGRRAAVQMNGFGLFKQTTPSGYCHVGISATSTDKYTKGLRATIEALGGTLINSGGVGPVGSVDIELCTYKLASGEHLDVEIDNWGMGDLQGPEKQVEQIDLEMRTCCGLAIGGSKVGEPLRFRIGDRVSCTVGEGSWRLGEVVTIRPDRVQFHGASFVAMYLVRLDAAGIETLNSTPEEVATILAKKANQVQDGQVYVPADDDDLLRPIPGFQAHSDLLWQDQISGGGGFPAPRSGSWNR